MASNAMAAAFAVPLNPVQLHICYCGNLAVLAGRCNGKNPDSAINVAW